MALEAQLRTTFREKFGGDAVTIIRAPGRVNLIGEHTDYNDGFVLPMAIDRAVWIALRPRQDDYMVVYSIDYDEMVEISLSELERLPANWAEYMKGVAWAMQEAGFSLRGWEGVITGDVPRGAGLSSSAAIELATARALCHVSEIVWDAPRMALISQRAENQWVGVNCGIMDQMISAAGVADHALLIDCRTLETELAPLPQGAAVVILDTTTRRGLVDSAYNERRQQCEAAAQHFGVKALRDVTLEQLEAEKAELSEVVYRRARHIISENTRTLQAVEKMRANDSHAFGVLMQESHASLRDDFEVTNDALNTIVACALAQAGCYGARMTGAGFGGCAVALVAEASVSAFVEGVISAYRAATTLTPQIYVCQASDGAHVMA